MPGPATIDHLVIRARDLESGSAYVADALGIDLVDGGAHPAMGTHNRVTGIGDAYLEVIAVDPDASAPDRARWFGLDELADDAPPRLHAWIARVDEPVETPETGPALALSLTLSTPDLIPGVLPALPWSQPSCPTSDPLMP